MSFEGVGVIAAAPLVVPAAGVLVAAAGVALATTAAIAVAAVVVPTVIRGTVAGTELAIQAGTALASAVDTAISNEVSRQERAYEARFERTSADRQAAIARLQQQLVQRAAPEKPPTLRFCTTAAPVPTRRQHQAETDWNHLAALATRALQQADRWLEAEASRGDRLSAALAAAVEWLTTHPSGTGSQTLRNLVEAAPDRLQAGSDAERWALVHEVETTLRALQESEEVARKALERPWQAALARLELLELAGREGRLPAEAIAPWSTRMTDLTRQVEEDPAVALPAVEGLVRDVDAFLATGRQEIQTRQRDGLAERIRASMERQGYALVSEGAFGSDLRIAFTHPVLKRRVVYRLDPELRLHFDLMDGHHGETCAELLEQLWKDLEAAGVVLGPPQFDRLHETLMKVGERFKQRFFRFEVHDEPLERQQQGDRDRLI